CGLRCLRREAALARASRRHHKHPLASRAPGAERSARERFADAHRALQVVARLQNLLSQVDWQLRVLREERIDHAERLGTFLTAHEASEPRPKEEDPAIALDPRQAVERR